MVKSGQLTGLSLGGMRRRKSSEEKPMAKRIDDALEGYTYRGVEKAEAPNPNAGGSGNMGPGPIQPAGSPPKAPKPVPGVRSDGAPIGPQVKPAFTDHGPLLRRRFQDFLRSLEPVLGADRYRAMLSTIVEYASRAAAATAQSEHQANAMWLAGELKRILISEHDVVKVLKGAVNWKALKGIQGDTTTLAGIVVAAAGRVASLDIEQDVQSLTPGYQARKEADEKFPPSE